MQAYKTITIFMTMSTPVMASENSENYFLITNLASKHFNTQQKFNENNLGIGIGLQLPRNRSLQIGTFRNSINRDSLYLDYNKSFPYKKMGHEYSPGISAGVTTGYLDFPVPYITPTFGVGKNGFNLIFRYIPSIEGVTPSMLGLQAEIPIKK